MAVAWQEFESAFENRNSVNSSDSLHKNSVAYAPLGDYGTMGCLDIVSDDPTWHVENPSYSIPVNASNNFAALSSQNVGSDLFYPYEFMEENGAPILDVGELTADASAMPHHFVSIPCDSLFPDLNRHNFSTSISAVSLEDFSVFTEGSADSSMLQPTGKSRDMRLMEGEAKSRRNAACDTRESREIMADSPESIIFPFDGTMQHSIGHDLNKRRLTSIEISAKTSARQRPFSPCRSPKTIKVPDPVTAATVVSNCNSLVFGADNKRCEECHVTQTPLWRKNDKGGALCNRCGIRYSRAASKVFQHRASSKGSSCTELGALSEKSFTSRPASSSVLGKAISSRAERASRRRIIRATSRTDDIGSRV